MQGERSRGGFQQGREIDVVSAKANAMLSKLATRRLVEPLDLGFDRLAFEHPHRLRQQRRNVAHDFRPLEEISEVQQ